MIPQPEDRPTMKAEEVFELLEIDRRTGYAQVRAGSFPIVPIRVGRLIRFPTAQVRRLFDLDVGPPGRDDAPGTTPEATVITGAPDQSATPDGTP